MPGFVSEGRRKGKSCLNFISNFRSLCKSYRIFTVEEEVKWFNTVKFKWIKVRKLMFLDKILSFNNP